MQESLVRWHQLSDDQRAEIRDPTAWLAKVVSRSQQPDHGNRAATESV